MSLYGGTHPKVRSTLVGVLVWSLVFPAAVFASPEEPAPKRAIKVPGLKPTPVSSEDAPKDDAAKPATQPETETHGGCASVANEHAATGLPAGARPKEGAGSNPRAYPVGTRPTSEGRKGEERPEMEEEPRYRERTELGEELVQPLPEAPAAMKFDGSAVYDYPAIEAGRVVVSELPQAEQPTELRFRPEREDPRFEWIDPRHSDMSVIPQDGGSSDTPPNSLVQTQLEPAPSSDAPPTGQGVSIRDAGICDTGGVPPDLDMAVGPNHIITDYNSQFHVRNKSGVLQGGWVTYQALFTGRVNCGAAETSTNFLTDPQAVYDDQNDRFVQLMLRVNVTTNNSWLCVAASQTANPTGTWNTYEIAAPAARVADYPKMAIGEDAIFIGANNFTTTAFEQGMVWAVQKAAAYAGSAITPRSIALGANAFTPNPAERRGFAQSQYPPAGAPHYWIVSNGSSGAGEVWRWTQPTFSTGTMTLWGAFQSFLANNNDMSGTFTTGAIDGGDFRYLDAELRYPKLWTARAQGSGTFDGVQWAEIDVSGGSPALGQNGFYTIASKFLTWPDVTVDKNNSLLVGMTIAAENGAAADDFPGAWVTGREAGVTPNNTLEAAAAMRAGQIQYTSVETAPFRWGDYQGVAADPNGCDMWFTGAFSETGCSVRTGMWLGNYRFPSCSLTNGISLDKDAYTCNDSLTVTVEDSTAISASTLATAVVITSSRPDSETIAAAGWTCLQNCSGGNGTRWSATIPVSSAAGSNNNGTLNILDTNSILASYNDPHVGHPDPTDSASADCGYEICYYTMDPLTGGCDNDAFHDNGEVLTYDVGIANFDASNTGTFLADVQVKAGTDPNGYVDIVNATAIYGDTPPGFYSYALIPFKVRYTGPLGSTCGNAIQLEIVNIRASNGAWTSQGCAVSPGAVTTVANLDSAARSAVTTYNFDAGLGTWTNGNAHGSTAAECAGGTGGCPAGGAYSNGNWVASAARPYTGAGQSAFIAHNGLTCSDKRLLSPSTNFLSGLISEVGFRYWADTEINNATTCWDGIILEASSDNGVTWNQVSLTPPYPGQIANYTCVYDAPFPNYQGGGNTDMVFGDGAGATVAGDQYNQEMIGNLAPWLTATQGRVRFRSSADDFSTTDEGVYVDQVVFYTAVACEGGTCSPAPDLQYAGEIFDDCNANGYLEPGETGELQLYVDNIGNDDAHNVTGTLTCPTCPVGVTICDGTADFGYIPFGTQFVYGPATDVFSVAVSASVPCGTVLPFQLTLTGQNSAGGAYGPVVRTANVAVQSEVVRFEDHFSQDPAGTAATGRVGFTTPGWTESAAARVTGNNAVASTCTGTDGDGVVANILGTGGGASASFNRTFSTVGATADLKLHFEMRLVDLDAGEQGAAQYTTNGGTNWFDIRRVTGTGVTQPWNCYDVDLDAEFGAGVLNNANFGIRFIANANTATEIVNFDNFQLVGSACASTTCNGACAGGSAPPPVADGTSGTPMLMSKGAGSTINITWDGATCSSDHAVVVYGNLGTFTGYVGQVTTGCNIGASGTGSFTQTPNNVWFNVIWVSSTNAAGHPGFSSSGPRTWTATGFCSVATDNQSDPTCP